jgi:hypothetical protein
MRKMYERIFESWQETGYVGNLVFRCPTCRADLKESPAVTVPKVRRKPLRLRISDAQKSIELYKGLLQHFKARNCQTGQDTAGRMLAERREHLASLLGEQRRRASRSGGRRGVAKAR